MEKCAICGKPVEKPVDLLDGFGRPDKKAHWTCAEEAGFVGI